MRIHAVVDDFVTSKIDLHIDFLFKEIVIKFTKDIGDNADFFIKKREVQMVLINNIRIVVNVPFSIRCTKSSKDVN